MPVSVEDEPSMPASRSRRGVMSRPDALSLVPVTRPSLRRLPAAGALGASVALAPCPQRADSAGDVARGLVGADSEGHTLDG